MKTYPRASVFMSVTGSWTAWLHHAGSTGLGDRFLGYHTSHAHALHAAEQAVKDARPKR